MAEALLEALDCNLQVSIEKDSIHGFLTQRDAEHPNGGSDVPACSRTIVSAQDFMPRVRVFEVPLKAHQQNVIHERSPLDGPSNVRIHLRAGERKRARPSGGTRCFPSVSRGVTARSDGDQVVVGHRTDVASA